MLQEDSTDLAQLNMSELDVIMESSALGKDQLKTNHGSGSGGFTENLFIVSAKELFSTDFCNSGNKSELEYRTLKNADFQEITLEHEGKVVLSFAIANGFRNIQNLVQKMKRKRCHYDFVEVMACPSGCLNGGLSLFFFYFASCLLTFFLVAGAQCRPEEGVNPKEMLNQLETKYKSLQKQWPTENEILQAVYLEWLGGKSTDKADHMLYTDYHEVEKMTNSLAIKW